MRDYDSDTGYRSDQELIKFRQQQQQMYQRLNDNYSEIVPVTRPKGRRRDGYSSDLEGYSQRSMGAAYHETSAVDNRNFSNRNNSLTRSFTYDTNQQSSPTKSHSQYSHSETVRNDELYEQNMADPSLSHYPSSSPSPLQRRNIVDQSTPLTPNPTRSNYKSNDSSEFELKKDLFNAQDHHRNDGIIDPENRYMVRYDNFMFIFLTILPADFVLWLSLFLIDFDIKMALMIHYAFCYFCSKTNFEINF
jgi:hypothetical protein